MDRKEYQKSYRELHRREIKEYKKKWYQKNKAIIIDRAKKYYQKHKAEIREKNKSDYFNKKNGDMNFIMKQRIRKSVYDCVKSGSVNVELENLIGITIKEIKETLEGKFEGVMRWENFINSWRIDHIIPDRVYNFYDKNDIKRCWNKNNLFPSFLFNNFNREIDWVLVKKNKIEELVPDTLLIEDFFGVKDEI